MTKKISSLIILLGLSITIFSQEELATFKNDLKTSNSYQKGILTRVNSENDKFSIFITDAKNVYSYNFNDTFSVESKLKYKNKKKKYKHIIGYSYLKNGDYKVYLKNKKNEFLEVYFSLKNNSSTAKEFHLLTDYENYLQSVTIDNKFYILSSSKDTNDLYIYTFDEEIPKRNKIDISKLDLFSVTGNREKLMPILINKLPLLKFDENTPNSMEVSARNRKMYIRDNTIIFTLDHNSIYTQIVTIDLKTFKASSKKIKKGLEQVKRKKKKTNSFLHQNNLFTVAISKGIFNLRIIDFNTKEILKEHIVKKDDSIDFKNSPLFELRHESIFHMFKTIKKTKKFLYFMNYGKPVINVQYNNEKYYLTIGSFFYPEDNSYAFGYGSSKTKPGTPVFSSTNNIKYSFSNYLMSYGFVKFSSVFDKNLNHLKTEKNTNAFDKMKKFLVPDIYEDTSMEPISLEEEQMDVNDTVFKYKDFYIYIDYNTKSKTYKLLKFTN